VQESGKADPGGILAADQVRRASPKQLRIVPSSRMDRPCNVGTFS